MIKNFIITGDTHGHVVLRLEKIKINYPDFLTEETAVIILGDAGINYWLNNSDKKNKRMISGYGYTIYCVRGNHEERPENLGYAPVWDENVGNFVRMEEGFPRIRYLYDGGIYNFKGHRTLVIGGAYSIDKWYRLSQAKVMGYSGWFEDEQLTAQEQENIFENCVGQEFDFILSHTCPEYFEPTDLFLEGIDQSTVDKSMEQWMNRVAEQIDWKVWCFGHFHADRIECPAVEQFYYRTDTIDNIWDRWYGEKYFTPIKDWGLDLSPKMLKLSEEWNE